MRRAHTVVGNGYRSTEAVEEENESLTDELQGKIHALKSLTIDIGAEVRQQNKFLNDVLVKESGSKEEVYYNYGARKDRVTRKDTDFEGAHGILGKTMNRVLKLAKGSHNYYLLYLFIFSFFVFLVLWLLLKFRV